jgi:mono/diheme cytochrome c family protein/plastocyanin
MTEQHQEPSDRAPESRLPARREPSEAAPARSADRFTAPRSIRAIGGLTPERAAKIVRQSGDARWVAFLFVAIVALFVVVYYFYELGAPFNLSQPRLEAEADAQQVTSIERGYNLYEANCSRCHGVNGEGGIGPVLNDQAKLFSHLTPQYIKTVLTTGGRYVCGNPHSLMPVWADTNGGPLNYIQIQDLINFIRAPSTQEFEKRDPSLNEPVIGSDGKVETFKGWLDPSFKPDPSASPVPDCWSGTAGGGTPAPPASLPADAVHLALVAQNFAFDKTALEAKAGAAFAIDLDNKDTPGTPHNVEIKKSDGTVIDDPSPIDGGTSTTYVYQPLTAGTYTFICRVHPIPAMTGTLTVK